MKRKLNVDLIHNETGAQFFTWKMIGMLLAMFLLVPVFSNSLSAQDAGKTITGKVISEEGESIPGVSVSIVGTSIGTVTNVDGGYSIVVSSSEQKLTFSFIGMESQTVLVGDSKVIDITLMGSSVQLDEIVAVGYGTMKRSDLTGSVVSVHSDDIVASGSGTLEEALSGRMAGVTINTMDNAPGAGLTLSIRGTNSINASSAPLYVIDGFPVVGSFGSGGSLTSTGSSPLSGIDPGDIESIDVLKDASATAIYGARGANGVVIITTKSGREGKTKVSFSAKYGVQSMIEKYDALDALGFAEYKHGLYFPFDKRIDAPEPEDSNYEYWNYETFADSTSTDWMDEITQLGEMQNYNLSISGGNATGNYLGSISYYNNKGIVKETDFSRYTGNFKTFAKPNDWLEVAFSTRFSFTENNGTVTINSEGAANYAGLLQQAIRATPLKSPDENYLEQDDDDGVTGNPLSTLENVDMLRKNLQSVSNASITIIPWKDVRIKSMVGMTHGRSSFKYYAPSYTSWGANYNGQAKINSSESTSWLSENTITVKKEFGDHTINVLGGFSAQSDRGFGMGMSSGNFPIETLGYNNIGVGESPTDPSSSAWESLLLSYMGRINYNYKDRYLVTSSYRMDGSSKFAKNNKWGYFPSVALAWRASEESFIKDLGFFDNLKLRAGWGETGNPNIGSYRSLTNYGLTKYPSGSTLTTGVYPSNIGNPNLRWETSVQSNVGLDLSIFNSRLSLTVDAYHKETKDLLLSGQIPPSTGFGTYLYNSGNVVNRGIEVAINALAIDNDVKWFIDFNIAFNENEVTGLGDLASEDWMSIGGKNYATAILEIGKPVGLWYGYKTDGLWQQSDFTWDGSKHVLKPDADGNVPAALTGSLPGQWKRIDLSGPEGIPDGKIDSWDKTVIGISQPKFTGGLNNRVEYKNFDLAMFLEWSYGRDMYNANNLFFIQPANQGANSIVVDRWAPIQYALDENGMETTEILDQGNIDAKYPGTGSPYQDMHDGYIEDGSYLRIKTITLGYTFNTALLKSLDIGSMRIYANIMNLHTFTSYSGYDPNVNAQSMGGLRPGYDYSSYPLSRTYMLGVSVEF